MRITGKDISFWMLMAVVAVSLYLIATRQVTQDTSYGFQEILGILGVIAGAFVTSYVLDMKPKP